MVCVGLVAAAARLPQVYTQAFWEDEVASARIINEPTLPRMLAHVARTESTPPLWYGLGWLAHEAGAPTPEIRLLSVLAGALLAVLVVDVGRRFLPLPFAGLAGLLAALGGEFVGHGWELRSYELLALLAVVFARCLLVEIESPSRRREVALAATVAAGGLTHFFFAFSVLTALAWLWLDPGVRAVRRRASIAILIGGAVAASWGPVLLTQYHQGRFWWIGSFRIRTVLAVPLRLFTYAYANTTAGFVLSAVGLLLVVAGCSRLARASAAGRLIVVLALAPVIEAALVWAGGLPIFALRNLIGIGPFVAVAAASSLAAVPRRVAMPVAGAITATLALSLLWPSGGGIPPYDAMARALVADGWSPSKPIAVFGDFFRYRGPLEWYLPHQPVLDASRLSSRICKTLFVLRGDTVHRLHLTRPIRADRALRGATILVDPATAPSCLRPIRSGHLAALT